MLNHPSIRIIAALSPSPAGRVGEGERREAARLNSLAWCTPTRSRAASRLSLEGEVGLGLGVSKVQEDVFQDTFDIRQDVMIPISKDLIAMCFDNRRPFRIGRAVGMVPAVELDSDPRGAFSEVDDEIADGELLGEFMPAELFATQVLPEPDFGIGRRAAQFPGDWGQSFGHHLSLLPGGKEVGGGGARRRVGTQLWGAVHPLPTLPLKGEGFCSVNCHTVHSICEHQSGNA
jgi:hypothetical protein